MAKKLGSILHQFIADSNSNSLSIPDDGIQSSNEELDVVDYQSFIEEVDQWKQQKKEENESSTKKKKKDPFEKVIENGNRLISEMGIDQIADSFDGFVDNYFLDEEDGELKRNLVQYGRKYARDTQVSAEASEIAKTYSSSERRLEELLTELTNDSDSLQKDITNMRAVRARNFKALSEMLETKVSFHNTKLAVIKEINAMKKNQIELQMKVDKTRKEETGDASSVNRAIQGLFGLGRENLMSSYEDISGSVEAGKETSTYNDEEYDQLIQQKYFNSDQSETDGDKFLKYEGSGAHYILLIDDNGHKNIITEDADGNLLPDYPTPSNIDDLDFVISEATGTATDNMANNYEIRHV